MPGIEMLVFVCAVCGHTDAQCPECVNTIGIDPETNLPPDVEYVGGKATPKTPSEAAKARSSQQPFCDVCTTAAINRGAKHLMTAAERHRRLHLRLDVEHVL
jgi:hypothetical protein